MGDNLDITYAIQSWEGTPFFNGTKRLSQSLHYFKNLSKLPLALFCKDYQTAMAMNLIQFQAGLSLPVFLAQFGTDEQCADALEASRWPQGFQCPDCGNADYYLLKVGKHKTFQCKCFRLQTSLIAGTLFQSTHLALNIWFLAIYLAMVERDAQYTLCGHVQADDAYLGGELAGSKAGRGSENKVPFVTAISLSAKNYNRARIRLKDYPIQFVLQLRSNGGAAVINLLVQFQADSSAIEVLRPANLETTAQGTAYLAGNASGLWSIDELNAKWRFDRSF